jgi:hypothetical protein
MTCSKTTKLGHFSSKIIKISVQNLSNFSLKPPQIPEIHTLNSNFAQIDQNQRIISALFQQISRRSEIGQRKEKKRQRSKRKGKKLVQIERPKRLKNKKFLGETQTTVF